MTKLENGRSRIFVAVANQRAAIFCALLLAVCTLASYPCPEIGGNDDSDYVRPANALDESGHLVYLARSSAILGWQLALGALFIQLFGASSTLTRTTTLLVAASTAFLLQRT